MPSVGVMQAGASGSDVDVRGSSFAPNRARKRVVWNLARLEIAAQPHSFGVTRIDGHVQPAGMIESQCAMQVGFTLRADGQRMIELLLERYRERLQIPRLSKDPAAFVVFHTRREQIAILHTSRILDRRARFFEFRSEE